MFISELLLESTTKHAAFCFGRMNPPTVGHEQLIKTVGREASGGDYFIFVSQTQDSKKNPLDYQQKIRYLRAIYPGMASHFVYEPGLKTIMQVAEWLYNKGYTSVTFVAGSDRLPEFEKLLNAYNGVEGKGAYYKFDNISYASSGERDPDSDGIGGISASMAREAAVKGDFETFSKAVDAGSLTKQMYDAVRAGMGVQDAELAEGALDSIKNFFKKQNKPVPELLPITDEQRNLIRQYFKSSNANVKYGDGSYVIKLNVHATNGRTSIAFYNNDGNLTAGVSHYHSPEDIHTKGRIPAIHSEHPANTPEEMEEIFALGESMNEGWKSALAGAALIGGIGAGMVASNPLTIDGVTYQSSMQGPDSSAESSTAKIITHNGKKYLVWKGTGPKPSHRAWKYKEVKPQQDTTKSNIGFDKEKWKKPYELEPTDLWVNESTKKSIQKEITELSNYIADATNGGGAGMLKVIEGLKSKLASLNEMFGPMGGDQRNMRGSQPRIEEPAGFSGSLTVSYPNFKNYALASKYNVQVSDSGGSDKNLTITGNKKNIKQFLVASGWNSSDLRNWYPELHENDNDSWAVEINGEVVPAHNQDHAMNKARNALSYKKADVVYILHNGKKVYSWKLGEKLQAVGELTETNNTEALKKDIRDIAQQIGQTLEKLKAQRAIRDKHLASQTQPAKTIKEASGYIPKNAKEAKDPRWSNALSVDVGIDTPAKNLKAFGL